MRNFSAVDSLQEISRSSAGAIEDAVHDFDWYPWMQRAQEGSCCFATSGRNAPVILWDALSGCRRASYLLMDHLDQMVTGYSCQFSPDGSRLVAGTKASLYIFDLARPGNNPLCIYHTAENKRDREHQTGILSTLEFRKDNTFVLAAGSFDGTTGVYDLRIASSPQFLKRLGRDEKSHLAVSQVKFSSDGWHVYIACRRDPWICKLDLRTGNVVSKFGPRPWKSNQRIYFDAVILTDGEEALISGDQDGNILLFREGLPILCVTGQFKSIGKPVSSVSLRSIENYRRLAFTTGERICDLDETHSSHSLSIIDLYSNKIS